MDFVWQQTRSTGDRIVGIFTVDGQYMGKNLEELQPGIYVVKTTKSSYKIIK